MKSLFNKLNDEKKYWLISAVSSMALIMLVMSYADVLGNGKWAFIFGDSYEQIAGFSIMLYRKIFEGSNMYYSFDAGLGMNTALLFGFVVFSPLNVLYALLGPAGINTASVIIFILKIGLSAAFFQLYCRYNLSAKGVISIFASLCYSLMAYGVYTSRMSPLYEAVYLLPLIFILIKYSVKNSFKTISFILLSLAYAYLFITNFYGGYIVGIVSFIYFVYLLTSHKKGLADKSKVFFKYSFSVIVAILLAGFLIAPVLYEALHQSVVENADSFAIVPLWEQIAYLFPFHSYVMYGVIPSYYCGIPILFMVPAFFFNSKVDKSRKYIAAAILVLGALSMMIKPIYLAAHMFNDPTGYACRYVYVIAFFIISMFVVSFQNIEGVDIKKIAICDVLFIIIYLLATGIKTFQNGGKLEVSIVYYFIATAIAAIWIGILLCVKKCDGEKKRNLYVITFVVLVIELGLNNFCMLKSMECQSLDNMVAYIDDASRMTSDLKNYDSGVYRVQYNASNNCDQGTLFDYMGTTLFSSSGNKNMKDFLESIGVFCNEFMITDCGNTELTRLLLNEKYIINGRRNLDEPGETNIVINENVAGMGYMVPSGIVNYSGDSTVFENQNSIYKYLVNAEVTPILVYEGELGIEHHNISVGTSEEGIVLTRDSLTEDGYVTLRIPYVEGKKAYTWMNAGYNRASFESPLVVTTDTENVYAYVDSYLSTPHIVKMASDGEFFTVYIYFGIDAVQEITLREFYFVYTDEELIGQISDKLSTESLQTEIFEDGYIRGRVDAIEDGILFMAIPYEEGWSASVDGQETSIIPLLDDAFIGIPIESGEHVIEMTFSAPYSNVGIAMSVCGVILLCLCTVFECISKRKKTS